MPDLTSKELTALEDQLTMEQASSRSTSCMPSSAADPQIRTKCEQIAAKHQNHYTRLLGQLN